MIIEQLKSRCVKLKLMLSSPRIYLAEHFENIKHEIDIKCAYLIRELQERNEFDKINELIKNQVVFMEKIDSFQMECLQQLPTNRLCAELTNYIENTINEIETNINQTTNIDEIPMETESNSLNEEMIADTFLIIERHLFLNKCLFFYETGNNSLDSLIFIEDEYFTNSEIENVK